MVLSSSVRTRFISKPSEISASFKLSSCLFTPIYHTNLIFGNHYGQHMEDLNGQESQNPYSIPSAHHNNLPDIKCNSLFLLYFSYKKNNKKRWELFPIFISNIFISYKHISFPINFSTNIINEKN